MRYFYPRSPCGERRPTSITPAASRNFYPRSPCGERPHLINCTSIGRPFLSTLSLRRATYLINTYHRIFGISIHALLAESDACLPACFVGVADFYPRSPCGERPIADRYEMGIIRISIHALLAESDPLFYNNRRQATRFLSTLSLRRATIVDRGLKHIRIGFLSTLSLRRATQVTQTCQAETSISIHALLAESDVFIFAGKAPYMISIHALLAESDGSKGEH